MGDGEVVCKDLKDKGIEVVEFFGDYYFNNDYDKVSEIIFDGLCKWLK